MSAALFCLRLSFWSREEIIAKMCKSVIALNQYDFTITLKNNLLSNKIIPTYVSNITMAGVHVLFSFQERTDPSINSSMAVQGCRVSGVHLRH